MIKRNSLILGPKTLSPRLSYSVHLKGNLQVERGPVNIDFTGPGRFPHAPVKVFHPEKKA
jgi:hypothetical protein